MIKEVITFIILGCAICGILIAIFEFINSVIKPFIDYLLSKDEKQKQNRILEDILKELKEIKKRKA